MYPGEGEVMVNNSERKENVSFLFPVHSVGERSEPRTECGERYSSEAVDIPPPGAIASNSEYESINQKLILKSHMLAPRGVKHDRNNATNFFNNPVPKLLTRSDCGEFNDKF